MDPDSEDVVGASEPGHCQSIPGRLQVVTVHSVEEARIRARIAAHVRRLFVEGEYASAAAFARALRIDVAQVWRVLTGERTPGLLLMVALHERLGADLHQVLGKDPPRRWFQPIKPKRSVEWG